MSVSAAIRKPEPGASGGCVCTPVRRSFVLCNGNGLHCRPAALLIRTLLDFESEVTLRSGERSADARSVVQLLTLCASDGATLEFTAIGPDAPETLQAVAAAFGNQLREVPANENPTQTAVPNFVAGAT